jgi:hypothetical protein
MKTFAMKKGGEDALSTDFTGGYVLDGLCLVDYLAVWRYWITCFSVLLFDHLPMLASGTLAT